MLRTALRPQWLAVLVVVLLLATGMSLLGRWQLDRARVHGAQRGEQSVSSTPVPLGELIKPRSTFPKAALGARTVATGEWDGARRLLITGRAQDGRTGYWVLVPLKLDDGSAVGVVRGWVPSPQDPAAAPAASPGGIAVRVTGLLQPSEPPQERGPGEGTGLPAGQLAQIGITDLITAWPYPLITGFIVAEQEQPADGGQLAGVTPSRVVLSSGDSGLDLRNVSYAFQWWLFAAFGLFMWWRLVRDDHLARTRPRPQPEVREDGELSSAPPLTRGVAP